MKTGESGTLDSSFTNKSKTKMSFTEKNRKETMEYIYDLEATLAINKEVIKTLCTGGDKANGNRIALAKLHEENNSLQQKNEELKNQNTNALNKVSILEQMLEDYKTKSEEEINELREKNKELVEQLNSKEYHLQLLEKRCNDAELVILKYLKNIPEAIKTLKEINEPVNSNTISNVVVQNCEMKKKIQELTNELHKIKRSASVYEMKQVERILKAKIQLLIDENEANNKKLSHQINMNQDLFELNKKLSQQLKHLNDKLNALLHGTKVMKTDVKTRSKRSKEESRTINTFIGESFSNISDISEENDKKFIIQGIDEHKNLKVK